MHLRFIRYGFIFSFLLLRMEAAMSADTSPVKIEWYGHSCFLFTLKNSTKILIDPYEMSRLPYSLPQDSVDLIFSTHDHFDHNAVKAVPSTFILRADGREPKFYGVMAGTTILKDGTTQVELKGIKLTCSTVPSYHDDRQGGMRGVNGIIRFTAAGLTCVHLGDLGDLLTPEQIVKLKPVDVLLVPVGGYYTIDSTQAQVVVAALNPKVVIPIHYKTARLSEGFPISGVDPFLKGYNLVRRENGSSVVLEAGRLPAQMQVIVLKYPGEP